MPPTQFTLSDLIRILVEGSGVDESVDLDENILDTPFVDFGYESLAILETVGRIEREYGVVLADSAVVDATTPRALIGLVNGHLTFPAAG